MIKRLFVLVALLSAGFAMSADIRTDFHNGMFEETKLIKIAEKNYYPSSNLVLAYRGISKTMISDHVFLPTTKLGYFNDGKADLENAIKTEPNNPELRYLRLLVQLNSPFFLGYSSNISSDVTIFVNNLKDFNISEYWKIKFIDNLLGTTNLFASDTLTAEQKNKIRALKTK